jgi:hypothetical protein
MSEKTAMEMFVVYKRPRDYPDKFVVRRWWVGKTPGHPDPDSDWFYLGETLEEVRAHVPEWCVRLERDPNDEPQIVEVWI